MHSIQSIVDTIVLYMKFQSFNLNYNCVNQNIFSLDNIFHWQLLCCFSKIHFEQKWILTQQKLDTGLALEVW